MLYESKKTSLKKRKKIIPIVYFLLILLIFIRYYSLQISQYENYTIKAGNNSVRKIVLNAPRGLILDRNEKPIVDNQLIYDINIIPRDFNVENFDYELFSDKVGISKKMLNSQILSKKKSYLQFKPILVKRHVDFITKSILEENKLTLKGLYFSQFPARNYSLKCNLTHVLGYLRQSSKALDGDDVVGFSGLEKYYQPILKGKDGVELHLIDRFGIDQGILNTDKEFAPIQGDSLVLTIDRDLQSYCESLIDNLKGSIIIANPKNGEIYTMFSFPDYSLDSFIGPIPKEAWKKLINHEDKPFNNRAIQNTYPPGSPFKLLLGAIALGNKIVDLKWAVNCNGVYDFHGTQFKCWKEEGHGVVNLQDAIQKSCNIYFYNLMQKIDFNMWSKEAVNFGFGEKSGIDLPNEKRGVIPNVKYMNETYGNKGGWSKGHLLNLSIGQGEILTTPIQIINLINVIANNGYSYKPHLKLDRDLIVEHSDVKYKKDVFMHIKKAMYDAVYKDEGTAYNIRIDENKAKVYGKTGTVQLCSNCDLLPHSWFTGILELDNEKLFTICVMIENGGKGSNIPTKLAKKIFDFIIENDI